MTSPTSTPSSQNGTLCQDEPRQRSLTTACKHTGGSLFSCRQEDSARRALSGGLPHIRNLLSSSPRILLSPNTLSHFRPHEQGRKERSTFAPNVLNGGLHSEPPPKNTSGNGLQLHLTSATEILPRFHYNTEAPIRSSQFPPRHQLNPNFVHNYQLDAEIGSGGYGFVMTAYHRLEGHEVAVKFIIKDKVPEHAWMEDEVIGRLPTEVVLLSYINHESIVKCLDLFEDELYFYLVQELHGSPWQKHHKLLVQPSSLNFSPLSSTSSTPALSPSSSEASLPVSEPGTPPNMFATIQPQLEDGIEDVSCVDDVPSLLDNHFSISQKSQPLEISRRPSHDLFECIEQSENKRLTEAQARYVFAQVVDAVHYLDTHGIAHRDIKDENLVIDNKLKIKLIDFGSATAVNPAEIRPYYKMFYGTAAYASSEILLKKDYQAAPAEIWTLGVLLSYLLAGISPFPTVRDAVDGKIFLSEKVAGNISEDAMDLMQKCLDPNPDTRATICQIKAHPWLQHRL